jgi:hypothetical protein
MNGDKDIQRRSWPQWLKERIAQIYALRAFYFVAQLNFKAKSRSSQPLSG